MNLRDWPTWKKAVGLALGLLVVADLVLVLMVWQRAREGPEAMRLRRDHLAIRAKLLRADVQRGEKIRVALPQAGKDCDAFYQKAFLDSSTGYSQIESDLGAIASKAGVKASGVNFKQSDVKDRGVTEISIVTGVDGNYPAILRFINGLERSKNFYLLDELNLDSASSGEIRLDLTLHAYFRT